MGISTHVLDTARGRPAAGIQVVLERRQADGWTELSEAATDGDGRVADLLDGEPLAAAIHRLTFVTGPYLDEQGEVGFYPEVSVVFEVTEPDEHHHVPLLLSPYGYSTYRGS